MTQENKTVFTNGCFDVVHIGHVRYLKEARALGSKLIVAINTDESVARLKGPDRPINKEQHRKEFLESFRFVDEVIFFAENTPLKTILEVKPDILVKGGDYKIEDIVGAKEVLEWGGEVKTLGFTEGFSSSLLIEKLN